MPGSEISELDAVQLGLRYRQRQLSPVEVTQACLAQIQLLNPLLNAFCLLDQESSLVTARASEQRFREGRPLGNLDGVPIGIKDILLARGWPTLRGSRSIDPNQSWNEDAPSVARLRAGGAVLIGKTTTSEFGWKPVTDSPLTGITRNPVNPEMTPGGSSGGSAAAVASGMVPLALGTDGAGSIRIPAAFCGVVGFKPTFGVVPVWPTSPFGALAHLGPIARSVPDALLLLGAIAGRDSRDPSSIPGVMLDSRSTSPEGLRIAYSPHLGGAKPDEGVGRAVSLAVAKLAELGAQVSEIESCIGSTLEVVSGLWSAGAAKLVDAIAEQQRPELDPGLTDFAQQGATMSALGYLELLKQRTDVAIKLDRVHDDFDLLVTPTLPIVAFPVGQNVPAGWHSRQWLTWTPYAPPFNLSQAPAISIPCGTSEGLPVGIQLVGRRYEDALLLRVATALEQVLQSS